jgi:rhamnosyl/mannosyltransferase
VTGRLVPPGDDEALTAALRDLLVNADARQRIGSAARSYVERHFAPRETAARTLDIYRELVPARRS